MAITDPTLSSVNPNASLQAPGALGGSAGTVTSMGTTGTPALNGTDLNNSLNSSFDTSPQAQTIMQQYNSTKDATSAAAASTAKSISDTGNYNLGYQSDQDKATGTQALESQRGFVVNPGQIALLQEQSTKRIRDLTQQTNDALSNNNTALAASLQDLSLQENTAMTNARTNFLNNYFNTQQEARSQASFQTPEQKSVMDLANAHPDAGITPTDSLADATAKVQKSPSFSQNIALGNANIQSALATAAATPILAQASRTQAGAALTSANASANLSNAQTRQLNTVLNSLQDSGGYASDVSSLLNNSATDATLHAKYDGYPGGLGGAIIANIEGTAQGQGWSPQASALSAAGQHANAVSLGGGGLGGLMTAGTNFLGSAVNKVGSSARSLSPAANNWTGSTSNGLGYTIH